MGIGPGLLLLAALVVVLPGLALAAGLAQGVPWLVHLSLGLAIGFGFLGGLLFPRFRRVQGALVPFLLFLAAAVFAVVEAHAVGTGIARGAPAMVVALLVPPLAIAAGSLWVAARRHREAAAPAGRYAGPSGDGEGSARDRGQGSPGGSERVEDGASEGS